MAIKCPPLPPSLPNGLPPAGSVEWCRWIDTTLQFFQDVGTVVSSWLNDNINWQGVYNSLEAYQGTIIAGGGTGSTIWANTLAWLLQLLKQVGSAIDLLKDVILCAWNMRKMLLPQLHPEAYLGVLLVKQVLSSIADWNIGVNWPVRGTGTIHIEIPALNEIVDHLLQYLLPIQMPSVGEATSAWSHGLIDTATRDCVWSYWGRNPHGYERYVLGSTAGIGPDQAIEWSRRLGEAGGLTTGDAIRRAGVVDPTQASAIIGLYDRLPSQSEAIQWSRTRADDAAFVAANQRDSGFDAWWATYQEALYSVGVTRDVARQNYIASKTQLGRGELEQMVHRLRPNDRRVPVPFTTTDYTDRLSSLGYTPADTAQLTQLLYRPLSIADAVDLYRRHAVGSGVVNGAYLDSGLDPASSQLLTQRDTLAAAQWRTGVYGGWTPQSAGKAYAIGLLTHAQVSQILTPLGGNAADVAALEQRSTTDYQYRILSRAVSRVLSSTIQSVKQSLSVGVMDVAGATAALVAAGFPAQQAAGVAQVTATTARTNLVKHAVAKIRSALLAGEITTPYAMAALNQLGIVQQAIAQYMAAWKIEATPARKRRSASQIVTDLAEGVMTVADATARLTNLGYEPADIQLYLEDAQRKQIVTAPARAEAAAQAAATGRGATAARAAYLPGLSKRAIAELKQQESPNMLSSYLHNGLISEAYASNRLQLYGWAQPAIDTFIQAARKAMLPSSKDPAPLPIDSQVPPS